MLKTCSSALLISSVPHFVEHISEIAKDVGVELEVTNDWNINYRMNADVVICGSKYINSIDPTEYYKVRLILKTDEGVSKFVKMGINHFIFDYNNVKEVAFAFFVKDEEDTTLKGITNRTENAIFVTDKYSFNFTKNVFKYEGVGIYLRESEKLYLANWLLLGKKDNDKRILLCKMRKKFGKTFLTDVDRFGQIIGGNNG